MSANYFISELYPHARHTAGVLREDIETVLLDDGYTKLTVPDSGAGFTNKVKAYIGVLSIWRSIRPGSKVLFHFPVRSRARRLLLRLLAEKQCCTIGYLHDFDGLRDENQELLQRELSQLQSFSVLLAQNKAMQQWVTEQVPGKKVVVIEMYDYLLATPYSGKRTKRSEVAFAGNPEKATFLKQLSKLPQIHFFLYGRTDFATVVTNCSSGGLVDPRALPAKLKGSFGLVWDGNSIATCSGGPGLYLRLITSHKIALYILAGLPIIIWNEAAMAQRIEANGIGFSIPSLTAIELKIAALTDAEYDAMCSKQKRLQQKIAAGDYLKAALAAI